MRLTKFHKTALSTIKDLGGVVETRGQQWCTPTGRPIMVPNGDGTLGRVGWPTVKNLCDHGLLERDEISATKYRLTSKGAE